MTSESEISNSVGPVKAVLFFLGGRLVDANCLPNSLNVFRHHKNRVDRRAVDRSSDTKYGSGFPHGPRLTDEISCLILLLSASPSSLCYSPSP